MLLAVATTAPEASVTTPSAKPIREPDFTTVPGRNEDATGQADRLKVVDLSSLPTAVRPGDYVVIVTRWG